MKFNLDSTEVKNAKRSSEQAGRQMWNSDEKPKLIKVKIKTNFFLLKNLSMFRNEQGEFFAWLIVSL